MYLVKGDQVEIIDGTKLEAGWCKIRYVGKEAARSKRGCNPATSADPGSRNSATYPAACGAGDDGATCGSVAVSSSILIPPTEMATQL
jgi:hypothetical protein